MHGGFWGVVAAYAPASDVTLALSFNQGIAGPSTVSDPESASADSLADRLARIAQQACRGLLSRDGRAIRGLSEKLDNPRRAHTGGAPHADEHANDSANDNGRSSCDERPRKGQCRALPGVADGTRTHDDQNHNLGLYQLSYSHR